MKKIQILILSLLPFFVWAQQSPEIQIPKARKGVFAIRNATLVTVTNGTFVGNLVMQDGKIADLGANAAIPAGAEVFDGTGLFVYPGLIDAGTTIGLDEVSSVEVTQDMAEVGNVNPHVQALTAVNPNSVLIPVTRVSGVTTCLVLPQGGLLSGTGSLINLHGYTPEQMYAGFKGVVLNFPSSAKSSPFDRRSEEDIKKAADKAIKELNDVWEKAKVFAKMDSASSANAGEKPAYYPEMQAMSAVVKGQMPLLIEVNAAGDILAAIKWVQEKQVKAVFMGVAEGWRVAAQLAEAKIPVIAGPILELPTRTSDRYDRAYANPGLMAKAGVQVAIRSLESENVRNLPYHAGFAAAYGMGKEEALKAVTIVPAEIMGVANRMGSLEKGKDATLFVTTGDPFETATDVKHVFINGWVIPIDSRHIRLYKEFLQRDPGLGK